MPSAAVRASLASVAKRLTPAISPISLAAVSTPQPRSASSCGASAPTRPASSRSSASIARVSSRMRRSSSRAIRTCAICSARARRPATRSCQLAWISARGGISSSGQRSCRPQRRSLISAVRCADEPLAVIDQQPDIELGAGELRDRQRVEPFADRGARDRDRVDRVGLAALARATCARRPSASAAPARRARRARAGSAPARPDTCRQSSIAHTRSSLEPTRPHQQILERAALRAHRHVGEHPAGRRHRPQPTCASPCACPPRSRSSAPSLQLGY